MERESHEMILETAESKVWVVINSEHFERSDKICIEGTFFTLKKSYDSAD